MHVFYKDKNLFAHLKSQFARECKDLHAMKSLSLIPSPLYFLQLRLVFAINELMQLLVSKDTGEIQIHRALSKVNRLSRLVYLKKREIKRKQEEFEFFMTQRAKFQEIFYFGTTWHIKSSSSRNFIPINVVVKQVKAEIKHNLRKQFNIIGDFFRNIFSFFNNTFFPKKKPSTKEGPAPKTAHSKEKKPARPHFRERGKHFCPAFAHMRYQFNAARHTSRQRYQPSHRRFGH